MNKLRIRQRINRSVRETQLDFPDRARLVRPDPNPDRIQRVKTRVPPRNRSAIFDLLVSRINKRVSVLPPEPFDRRHKILRRLKLVRTESEKTADLVVNLENRRRIAPLDDRPDLDLPDLRRDPVDRVVDEVAHVNVAPEFAENRRRVRVPVRVSARRASPRESPQ